MNICLVSSKPCQWDIGGELLPVPLVRGPLWELLTAKSVPWLSIDWLHVSFSDTCREIGYERCLCSMRELNTSHWCNHYSDSIQKKGRHTHLFRFWLLVIVTESILIILPECKMSLHPCNIISCLWDANIHNSVKLVGVQGFKKIGHGPKKVENSCNKETRDKDTWIELLVFIF